MRSEFIQLCLLLLAVGGTFAQLRKDRICASARHTYDCTQLQRGNSEVVCVYAQDAVECAQRIQNGTADFGIFSAESAFHIASMGWRDLTVIKEIRHTERLNEPFDYQSVVVVRAEHTGGVDNLRGVDFCHPGLHYGRHTRWTERFLKHFERSIVKTNCTFDGSSAAESEVAGLSQFFNAGCRPGSWSNNEHEDIKLKEKFTNLCALCDNPLNCTYQSTTPVSSHQSALECVTKSANAITYVALQEAQIYFNQNTELQSQFAYLCSNGTLQSIANNARPCVWLSQPWKVIVSGNEVALNLRNNLERWMTSTGQWEETLRQIILPDSTALRAVNSIANLADYIRPLRSLPIGNENCPVPLRWCTHNQGELEKCEVIRMAGVTTGIRPEIVCNAPVYDAVTCLSEVAAGRADFVGIDSNYGFIARNSNNLSAVLFEETETEHYSSVVVVIKERDSGSIEKFEDFRGKKACFPEFGGIASIAFINVAKGRGIFKREDCEFGPLLGGYFGDSCLPGSRSFFHDKTSKNPESLCTLCQSKAVHYPIPTLEPSTTTRQPVQPFKDASADEYYDDDEQKKAEVTPEGADEPTPPAFVPSRAIDCTAESTNRFYGVRGALACLAELGDVAVLEHQRLHEHAKSLNVNPNDFRVLCRNGSLAAYPGFDVDSGCFLTTIVDGEVVTQRNTDKTDSIVNVLLSLDKYLQNEPDFKMYNIFANETNLLFEDSAVGLVSPNDSALSDSVQNYIRLYEDVENCINETDGAQSIAINLILTVFFAIFTVCIQH